MIAGGPKPVAPFSHAVETDGFVFVTGQMPDTPDAPGKLPDGIAAQTRARLFKEVRTRFAGCNDALLGLAKGKFGVTTPFGGPTSSGMLTLHCPPAQVHALASFLRQHGAENVAVADLGYVFSRENPLYARLQAGLGG